MLKLYYAAHTCSLATHIVLEEVGADYSTVRVDFAQEQQKSPEFLKVNPKARVPALVTDRGILTETPAMLVYVAQSFPKSRLALMDDPFAFAQVQAFNAYLCSHLHVAHARMHQCLRALLPERRALLQNLEEARADLEPLRRSPAIASASSRSISPLSARRCCSPRR